MGKQFSKGSLIKRLAGKMAVTVKEEKIFKKKNRSKLLMQRSFPQPIVSIPLLTFLKLAESGVMYKETRG